MSMNHSRKLEITRLVHYKHVLNMDRMRYCHRNKFVISLKINQFKTYQIQKQ